jgi:hypothetical protein
MVFGVIHSLGSLDLEEALLYYLKDIIGVSSSRSSIIPIIPTGQRQTTFFT